MTRDSRLAATGNQIRRGEIRLVRLRRTSERASWARLAIFAGGLTVSAAAYFLAGALAFAVGVAVTVVAFGIAVYFHRQVDAGAAAHDAWLRVKMAQVARMRRDWPAIPAQDGQGPRFDHPFEADLDLYGE